MTFLTELIDSNATSCTFFFHGMFFLIFTRVSSISIAWPYYVTYDSTYTTSIKVSQIHGASIVGGKRLIDRLHKPGCIAATRPCGLVFCGSTFFLKQKSCVHYAMAYDILQLNASPRAVLGHCGELNYDVKVGRES